MWYSRKDGKQTVMRDHEPSHQKSVSGIKYLLRVIFLLMMVIAISLTIFYVNNVLPHDPKVSANVPQVSANAPQASTAEPQVPVNESLDNKRSESLSQLSPSLTSAGPIKVVYELPVKQPVVYITIDDGWYPNEDVLKLMQQYHLPITTFLIVQAAQKQPVFWHDFVKAGGHIEDHTISHPYLTHLSLAEEKSQISQPIDYFHQYGPPLEELRPPYGDFNLEVGKAAWDSGIKYVVMWDAEMENSTLSFRSNRGLKAGDIILLHWVPGLDQELLKLLNIIQKQNLGIADLTQALKGEPLTICWLKTPLPIPKPKLPLTTAPTVTTSTSGAISTSGATGTHP